MKKRLIDFTLEEMQELKEDKKEVCSDYKECSECKYYSLCNCDFFDVDFSKEFVVSKPKPKLTEVEKIILKSLDKNLKWIARDKNGKLCLYETKPYKSASIWSLGITFTFFMFNHLFEFIKWEDDEPYCIEKLLN